MAAAGGCDSLKLTPLVEEIVSVAEEQHEECDDLEHDINDMEVAVQLFSSHRASPVPDSYHTHLSPSSSLSPLPPVLLAYLSPDPCICPVGVGGAVQRHRARQTRLRAL